MLEDKAKECEELMKMTEDVRHRVLIVGKRVPTIDFFPLGFHPHVARRQKMAHCLRGQVEEKGLLPSGSTLLAIRRRQTARRRLDRRYLHGVYSQENGRLRSKVGLLGLVHF